VVRDRGLLFFGDSHVVGVGDPTGLGWVGRVVAASFAAGMPAVAYNLGVRGETSVEVRARWLSEAQPRLRAETDMRVVLSFGVNDTTVAAGRRRASAESSEEALAAILDEAATSGLPALVVGPAPIGDHPQNQRIEQISASFAEICSGRDTPFIAVFEPLAASDVWMAEVRADDGAHPSADGYTLLAQQVLAGGFLDWLRITDAATNDRARGSR
jgi:acyl-CoA thioesterase-1